MDAIDLCGDADRRPHCLILVDGHLAPQDQCPLLLREMPPAAVHTPAHIRQEQQQTLATITHRHIAPPRGNANPTACHLGHPPLARTSHFRVQRLREARCPRYVPAPSFPRRPSSMTSWEHPAALGRRHAGAARTHSAVGDADGDITPMTQRWTLAGQLYHAGHSSLLVASKLPRGTGHASCLGTDALAGLVAHTCSEVSLTHAATCSRDTRAQGGSGLRHDHVARQRRLTASSSNPGQMVRWPGSRIWIRTDQLVSA